MRRELPLSRLKKSVAWHTFQHYDRGTLGFKEETTKHFANFLVISYLLLVEMTEGMLSVAMEPPLEDLISLLTLLTVITSGTS